jgi:hypothetical protein
MRTFSLFLLLPLAAAASTYLVNLNTASLPSAGTFYLDFQFIDGSGTPPDLNNNSVALSDFSLGGGASAGAPTLTGGASGTAATTLLLTDAQFFNEIVQSFNPGTSLSFQVSLTTAIDPGGTPDQFSFAILDSTETELPTNGPASEFLSITLNGTPPTVLTYDSAPGAQYAIPAPNAVETDVPEPSPGLLLGGPLVGMCILAGWGASRLRKA